MSKHWSNCERTDVERCEIIIGLFAFLLMVMPSHLTGTGHQTIIDFIIVKSRRQRKLPGNFPSQQLFAFLALQKHHQNKAIFATFGWNLFKLRMHHRAAFSFCVELDLFGFVSFREKNFTTSSKPLYGVVVIIIHLYHRLYIRRFHFRPALPALPALPAFPATQHTVRYRKGITLTSVSGAVMFVMWSKTGQDKKLKSINQTVVAESLHRNHKDAYRDENANGKCLTDWPRLYNTLLWWTEEAGKDMEGPLSYLPPTWIIPTISLKHEDARTYSFLKSCSAWWEL